MKKSHFSQAKSARLGKGFARGGERWPREVKAEPHPGRALAAGEFTARELQTCSSVECACQQVINGFQSRN